MFTMLIFSNQFSQFDFMYVFLKCGANKANPSFSFQKDSHVLTWRMIIMMTIGAHFLDNRFKLYRPACRGTPLSPLPDTILYVPGLLLQHLVIGVSIRTVYLSANVQKYTIRNEFRNNPQKQNRLIEFK